ncbi:sulfatase [Pararhodobacter sp.]|uniref:sulfatase family protein n=1 Tax=Pararhodobacter sp. TaxID=2127056 RepID=UPI002AFEF9FF|nr:sulfatase-like hydrolase/transferase [Pararhodobacter sp.]
MTQQKRPNFIVFMTDQQRADHLGCYGNPIVRTPHIDSLAATGTRFDQFYVTTPICQPNRAALMTGQMTSVNGCRQNGIPMGLDSTTYADVLRAAGYRTALVGKAHFQNVTDIPTPPRNPTGQGAELPDSVMLALRTQRAGPDYRREVRASWAKNPDQTLPLPYYGFDHVRLCIGHGDQVEGHYSGWLRDHLHGAPDPRGRANAVDGADAQPQIWRTALPEALYPTAYIQDEATAFLEQADDAPFLLVVSFPDPHHPFTPPGKYFDMYDPADMPLPPSFENKTRDRNDLPAEMLEAYAIGDAQPDAYWPFHPDAEHMRRMLALNYGSISMVDDAVGKIMETLTAKGLNNETVICFMSDHGDYMGDHGTVLKHGVHSEGAIRVPFIWRDPAMPPGKTTTLQGSAIDFAPTILQRAGLKVPVGMQGGDLFDAARGNVPVLIEDPGMGVYRDPDARTSIRTLVHDGWRLSIFEQSSLGELYDLTADPHEVNNLWASPDSAVLGKKADMLFLLAQTQLAFRDRSILATNQA